MALSHSPPRFSGRGERKVYGDRPSGTRLPRIEGQERFGAHPVFLGAGAKHDYSRSPGRQGELTSAAAGYGAGRSSSERRQRVESIKRSRRRRHAAEEVRGDWADYECRRKWDEVRREHAQRREQERAERLLSRSEALPQKDVLLTSREPSPETAATDVPCDLTQNGTPLEPLSFTLSGSLPTEAGEPSFPLDFLLRPRPPSSPKPPGGATPRAALSARPVALQSIAPSQLPALPQSMRLQEVGNRLASPCVEATKGELRQSPLELLVESTLSTEAVHQNTLPPTYAGPAEMSSHASSAVRPPFATAAQSSASMPPKWAEPAEKCSPTSPATSLKPGYLDELLKEDDADEPICDRSAGLPVASSPLLQWTGGHRRTPSIAGSTDISEIRCDPEPLRLDSQTAKQVVAEDSLSGPSCSSFQPPSAPVAPAMPLPEGRFVRKDLLRRSRDQAEIVDTEGKAAAAIAIQSAQRCRQARQELATQRASRDREEFLKAQRNAAAALVIQNSQRCRQARKQLAIRRASRDERLHEAQRKEAAALAIQSSQRCRQARKELAIRQASRDEKLYQAQKNEAAAVVIQSSQRCRQARKQLVVRQAARDEELFQAQKHEAAAVVIQSSHRCRQARKELAVRQASRDEKVKEWSTQDFRENSCRNHQPIFDEECDLHLSRPPADQVVETAAEHSATLLVMQAMSEALPTIDEATAEQFEMQNSFTHDWECVLDEDCEMDSSREAWEQDLEIAATRAAGSMAMQALANIKEEVKPPMHEDLAKQLMVGAAGAFPEEQFDSVSLRPSTVEEAAAQVALDVVDVASAYEEFVDLADDVTFAVIDMAASCESPQSCGAQRSSSSVAPFPLERDGFGSEVSEAYPVEREPTVVDDNGNIDDVLDEVLMKAVGASLEEVAVQCHSPTGSSMSDAEASVKAEVHKAAVNTTEATQKLARPTYTPQSIGDLRCHARSVLAESCESGKLETCLKEVLAEVSGQHMQHMPLQAEEGIVKDTIGEIDRVYAAEGILAQAHEDGSLHNKLYTNDKEDDTQLLCSHAREAFMKAYLNGNLQQAVAELVAVKEQDDEVPDDVTCHSSACRTLLKASSNGGLQQAVAEVASAKTHKVFLKASLEAVSEDHANTGQHNVSELDILRKKACNCLLSSSLDGTLQQSLSEVHAQRLEHEDNIGQHSVGDLEILRKKACDVLLSSSLDGTLQQTLSEVHAQKSEHDGQHSVGELDTLRKKACDGFLSASFDGTLQQTLAELQHQTSEHNGQHSVGDLEILRKKSCDLLLNSSLDGTLQQTLAKLHSQTSKHNGQHSVGKLDGLRKKTCNILLNSSLDGTLQQTLSEPYAQKSEYNGQHSVGELEILRKKACDSFLSASLDGTLQQSLSELHAQRSEHKDALLQSFEKRSAPEAQEALRNEAFEVLRGASLSGSLQQALSEVLQPRQRANHIGERRRQAFEVLANASRSGRLQQTLAEVYAAQPLQEAGDGNAVEALHDLRKRAGDMLLSASSDGTLKQALSEVHAERIQQGALHNLRKRAGDALLNASSDGTLKQVLSQVKAHKTQQEAQDFHGPHVSDEASLTASSNELTAALTVNDMLQQALSELDEDEPPCEIHDLDTLPMDVIRNQTREALHMACVNGTLQQALVAMGDSSCPRADASLESAAKDTLPREMQQGFKTGQDDSWNPPRELDDVRDQVRNVLVDSFRAGTLLQNLDNACAELGSTEMIDLDISEQDPLLEELGNVINEMEEAESDYHTGESRAAANNGLVSIDDDGIVQVAPLNLSLDFLDQEFLAEADCCGREAPATQSTGCGGSGTLEMIRSNSTWEELVEAECRSQEGMLPETNRHDRADVVATIDVDVPLSQFKTRQVDDLRDLQPSELHWPKWRTIHDRMSERLSTPLGVHQKEEKLNDCQEVDGAGSGATTGASCKLVAPTKPASQAASETVSKDQNMSTDWVRERWSTLRRPETSRPTSRAGDTGPQQSFSQLTSLDAFRQKLSAVSPPPSSQNVGHSRSMLPSEGGCAQSKELHSPVRIRPAECLPPPPDFDPPVCQEVLQMSNFKVPMVMSTGARR